MTEQEIEKSINIAAERNRQELAHVYHVVSEHNADLHHWCIRRRRYEAVRRTILAACLFVGCCSTWSSAMAAKQYDQIIVSDDVDSQHVCDVIRRAIENV